MGIGQITTAVLLVGGKGTRLRPLTYRRPKALVPLLNRPLISYEFELMARHGIRKIIMAVGYGAQVLRDGLGDGSRWGVELVYIEDPSPLGTAGAIKNVQAHIDGPFVAMNGDMVFDADVDEAIRVHLERDAVVTFCLRRVEDIRRYGLIQCDDDGLVRAFLEKQEVDATGRNTVNSGLYVMSPKVLDAIPAGTEFSNEHELFPTLLLAGETMVGHVPAQQGYWADVGTIESYFETQAALLAGEVPWVTAGISDGCVVAPSARLRGEVCIEDGVRIDEAATVGPATSVGAGTHIGPGAQVTGSILWENVEVGAGAHIEGCIVADGVTIPSGAQRTQEVLVP